jgi:dimethylhistidine N-methyltransferase
LAIYGHSTCTGGVVITQHSHYPLRFYDFEPQNETFLSEVLRGLQRSKKQLSSKYFYDERGSRLFEQICLLDEYYLTRTELHIMQKGVQEMASLLGSNCLLIEYGSGNSAKIRMLLDTLETPVGYVPIDISKEHLVQAGMALASAYPDLEVLPVCADYMSAFEIPLPSRAVARRVVYYPGSTIGNLDSETASNLLKQMATICQGGGLLIGVDLKKDPVLLHRAYNDRQGVTEQFNKNLLVRINRELGANFRLDQFGHYAFYNPTEGRVEMHLVSLKDQRVCIGDVEICFALGESIWTENSYKHTLEGFASLAATAGFTVKHIWTDPQQFFSVQYLTVKEE